SEHLEDSAAAVRGEVGVLADVERGAQLVRRLDGNGAGAVAETELHEVVAPRAVVPSPTPFRADLLQLLRRRVARLARAKRRHPILVEGKVSALAERGRRAGAAARDDELRAVEARQPLDGVTDPLGYL